MATERPATARTADYAPQLDGLRAAAVAAVAYSHWLPQWQFGLPFGAGVHLFFVLSGFLITRILLGLRDQRRPGAAIARFFARRMLRLFPAFYLVLAVAAWADVPLVRDTWPWHAAYLSNVYIAGEQRWLGHVSHFWSLAVEEQFYLMWPWVVVFAPTAWLGWAITALIVMGPAARLVAAAAGSSEAFWALVPGGSADSLGVGALLAWWSWRRASWPGAAPGPDRWGAYALGAGVAWTVLWIVDRFSTPVPPPIAVWRQVLQAVVFGWIVHRGAAGRLGALPWAHPAVRYIGRISYGVYLIHAFAPVLLHAMLRTTGLETAMPAGPLARAAVFAATTVAAAALMWRLVERPINALKARIPQQVASDVESGPHGHRAPASDRPMR